MKKTIVTVSIAVVAIVGIILLFVLLSSGITVHFGQSGASFYIEQTGDGMSRNILRDGNVVGSVEFLSEGKSNSDGDIVLKEMKLEKSDPRKGFFLELEIKLLTEAITSDDGNVYLRFACGESGLEIGVGKIYGPYELSSAEMRTEGDYTVFSAKMFVAEAEEYVFTISSVRTVTGIGGGLGD